MRYVVALALLVALVSPAEAQTPLPVPPPTCVAVAGQPDMESCTWALDISAAPEATYDFHAEASDGAGNKAVVKGVDFPLCQPLVRQRVGDQLKLIWVCKKGMTFTFSVIRK